MPIKVPNDLPAIDTLTEENVFVMTDTRAITQDMRPLRILLLNLMPTKIETETQLTRLLGNTPLQIELELLQTATHKATNTSEDHMIAFYKTFDEVKDRNYDGMVITGAPVEQLEFEEVDYWPELCEIMEWSKTHVHSTFHICWGAQAALYYHYGITKHMLPKKLSGIYRHHLDYKRGMLFRGFDDEFMVPHSRNTTVLREDIEKIPELKILASSDEAGVFCIKSDNDRQIFAMGHSEYDADTLLKEYLRDKAAGIDPEPPVNYFPDDDDTKEPVVTWRSCANLIYSNWLNYFVYQSTPYDIRLISSEDLAPVLRNRSELTVCKFGGTSLADAAGFRNAADIIKQDAARKLIVVSAPGKRSTGVISADTGTRPSVSISGIGKALSAASSDSRSASDAISKAASYAAAESAAETAESAESAALNPNAASGPNSDAKTAERRTAERKITDLLIEAGKDEALFEENLAIVAGRFREIVSELGSSIDIDAEMLAIREKASKMKSGSRFRLMYLASRGEHLCAKIMADYLGYDFVDAADLIKFDSEGGFSRELTRGMIAAEMRHHEKAVIPGFYGSDEEGRIVTFARGGSDITGALIAEGVRADLYENWTDVPGLLMADPKIVKNPLTVPVIIYKEIRELALRGAEVLHEDAVSPARRLGIPINIRSTLEPEKPGTLIVKNADFYDSPIKISGISGRTNYASILIEKDGLNRDHGIMPRISRVLDEYGIKISAQQLGVDSVALIADAGDVSCRRVELEEALREAAGTGDIDIATGLAVISVVGRNITVTSSVAVKIFEALSAEHVNIRFLDHAPDRISIQLGVSENEYRRSVKAIYRAFTNLPA